MAGLLDSLFGDLQGTSAGGLLGMLGGGGIGTATRRLRTPEEEQQAAALYGGNLNLPSQIPSGFSAPYQQQQQASPQDYVGTPGALDPKWQALLAGNTNPYQPNAQLPPTATPTVGAQNGPGVTLPQLSDGGFGRDTGPQNPLMGLLGGIGNLFGTSSAQAAPAPGTAQQPNLPAPAAAGPGLFGRLSAGANSLEGNNPFSALINGLQGLATGQRNDVHGVALQTQAATIAGFKQALMANGMPEAQAASLAQASLNPEVAKTLAPLLYRTPTIEKLKDATGAENAYLVDPVKGTRTELKDTGGGGTVGGTGGPQMLAPGVKQYNPALTGNDYMNQFGPELQAIAKMYLRGDEMPTGNPRTQGLIPFGKTVAAKYAQDMGIPFSDSLYAEKRKLKTDLAASSNSSMGGILSNGSSSFKHLAELGESFADLGNYAGPNIPGGAYIGEAGNFVGNSLAPTPKIRGQLAAIADNALHYGQESTKFYAATGGGEGERMSALKTVGGPGTNAEVQAAYLAKEKNLMLDRAREKFDQIRQTLGEEEANRVIAKKMPSLQESVSRIDKSIAKLRGEAAPQQGAAGQQQGTAPGQQQAPSTPATLPPPGKDGWIVLPNGIRIREKK